jgi:hypothetical protein
MAEQIVSPGVFTRENDQSFVQTQLPTAGAAIVGPTVLGRVGIPTLVTSYSDYVNKFGSTFTSGSTVYTYFTSIAAYNYFQNGGETLLVTRVASGSFTPASSTTVQNNVTSVGSKFATSSFTIDSSAAEFRLNYTQSSTNTAYLFRFIPTQSGVYQDDTNGTTQIYYFASGALTTTATNLTTKINLALSGSTASSSLNIISASNGGTAALVFSGSIAGAYANGIQFFTGSQAGTNINTVAATLAGGVDTVGASSFTLETFTQGVIANSSSSLDPSGSLDSGSTQNVRWEISQVDSGSGTFTLLVRQGNDNDNTKTILETWTGLSLDPKVPNYISKQLGDQTFTILTDSTTQLPYLQVTGSYPNVSKYVRVKSVDAKTPDYFDNNGNPKNQYTASLPIIGSGSFTGATGNIVGKGGNSYYETITNADIQGLVGNDYSQSLKLLANKDEYKYNVLVAPGLIKNSTFAGHATSVNLVINQAANRGDYIAVVDVAGYGSTITTVTNAASSVDSSFAATYWPWLQTVDPDTGEFVWVPASTMIPAVYAFNDSVSEPWFAPAGLNRGALSNVVRAERKLSNTDRDTLYLGNVNPIATFPNTGVVVYGQKTLQKKASALDRVNVRRLLISLKEYISNISQFLVFEQNTISTRNQFLSQVNPYLESVQQRQGLYAFKVVMDDSNNTPDVIDRNQLVGQIYLQPTKTAEFIILDFNVLPTGATFG